MHLTLGLMLLFSHTDTRNVNVIHIRGKKNQKFAMVTQHGDNFHHLKEKSVRKLSLNCLATQLCIQRRNIAEQQASCDVHQLLGKLQITCFSSELILIGDCVTTTTTDCCARNYPLKHDLIKSCKVFFC